MSSTSKNEAKEDNTLNIPDILADFFLKKFKMPSQSEQSEDELEERRKKSKHKKRKHKKHKHKHRSSSKDHSTEKDSLFHKMAGFNDRSDSEEKDIKRLKKIKNMEVKDVSKLCLQHTASLGELAVDQNSAHSANSLVLQNSIPYGPSIEFLLTGMDEVSPNSSLLSSMSSNVLLSSQSTLKNLSCEHDSKLVLNDTLSKCAPGSHEGILDSSSFNVKDCNNSVCSKSEKILEQNISSLTDAAISKNLICVKETNLNFSKAEIDKIDKTENANLVKKDLNICCSKQGGASKHQLNFEKSNIQKNYKNGSDSPSYNTEKCEDYSDLTLNSETINVIKELSPSNSASRLSNDKSQSDNCNSRSRSKTPLTNPSNIHKKKRLRSRSRSKEFRREHSENSRHQSFSRTRSRSKYKRHSRSKSKENAVRRPKRKSTSGSRSSSNSVCGVSYSKLSKKCNFSRSKNKRRNSRSHSRDRNSIKYYSSRKYSRSSSRSPSRCNTYNRSKSIEKHRKYQRSRSRSTSFDPDEKSRSRKSSRSRKYRSKHSRRSIHSRSRSQSYSDSKDSLHRNKFSDSRSRKHSHSPLSSSPDRRSFQLDAKIQLSPKTKEKIKSTLSQSDNKIDQAKILEIARKNVLNMIEKGTLPEGLSLEKFKKEQLVSIKAGGKSVQELTDFCVKLSKKENDLNNDIEDKNEDDANTDSAFIHHPFKLKEQSVIKMNIKNAIQVPVKTHAEKVAETARLSSQFPVSSGNQHKQKELEWIPVEPEKSKPVTKIEEVKSQNVPVAEVENSSSSMFIPQSNAPVTVCYPYIPPTEVSNTDAMNIASIPVPPAPIVLAPSPDFTCISSNKPPQPNAITSNIPMSLPLQPTTSVFKPTKPLDISSIVTMRFKALTKLQTNPNDDEALSALNQAQESIQQWVQSQQVPGLFTGSTDAKLLSVEELCGPRNYRVKRDIFIRAAPVTEGKGMSLLKKMGWNPGEGLGKNKEGSLEPLVLDIKTDKKGLVSEGEGAKKNMAVIQDLQGKHPVSALMELCSKRKWKPPLYTVVKDVGPPHRKLFIFKVEVNGIEYQPIIPCSNKKQAKADAAVICLQSLNVFPKNS